MRILSDTGKGFFYTLPCSGIAVGIEISMPPGEHLATFFLGNIRVRRHPSPTRLLLHARGGEHCRFPQLSHLLERLLTVDFIYEGDT
ncbi:hypothetical protein VTI74DRAFT_914 [Chaetomium olivicolor]